MTYNDLQKEVAALGFESDAPDAAILLTAANRALRKIFTERETRKRADFYISTPLPCMTHRVFLHKGRGEEIISVSAKAVSFTTLGNGSYLIKDASGEREFPFNSPLCDHRHFIKGEGEIVFLGDYTYSVLHFAAWDDILSPNEKDIPLYSETLTYEIKEFFPDYHFPLSPPLNKKEQPIARSFISGNTLILASDFLGEMHFYYKPAPTVLSGNGEEVIKLPDGCEHLLPLLVASYVWLDEDAEKSQYYAALYREEMASLKIYSRTGMNTVYHIMNGWA